MSSEQPVASVCVIGAGVSGLTTALELQSRGFDVTIVARGEGEETTSSAAAAFWYPFWTGKKPDHAWYRAEWAWATYLALEDLVTEVDAGVTPTLLVEYFGSEMTDEEIEGVIAGMWWQHMKRLRFERLDPPWQHVPSLSPKKPDFKFKAAIRFKTLVVNMRSYLPFLKNRFLSNGGKPFIREEVTPERLDRLCQSYSFVVNCAGFSSKELTLDSALVMPLEGVVVRAAPMSQLKDIVLLHTGSFDENPVYIVPRGGPEPDLILGGTLTPLDELPRHFTWDQLPQDESRIGEQVDKVLEGCVTICPDVANSVKRGVSVGYRPRRTGGVRLGLGSSNLVHNYGHGGGGVTLSWGCAQAVGEWIEFLQREVGLSS